MIRIIYGLFLRLSRPFLMGLLDEVAKAFHAGESYTGEEIHRFIEDVRQAVIETIDERP